MDKGCMCTNYDCDCYKPSNTNTNFYKEQELLNHLWQIKSFFGSKSDSIKLQNDCMDRLEIVIKKLESRGRQNA